MYKELFFVLFGALVAAYSLILIADLIFKQVVTAIVQQAMQYMDQTPDVETKSELIKTLNSVSAGKVNFRPKYKMSVIHCPLL